MHNAILPLNTADADPDTVGGKCLSLMNMVTAGFGVPAGFCVTTGAYRRFIDDNGLKNRILELARPRVVDGAMTFESASKEIQTLFAAEMSAEIRSEILSAYAGMEAVAVRSSATAEDLPDLSFAGQHDTYLNVRGEDALIAAVKNTWASLWTERAMSYRHQHGIDNSNVAIAVVVQIMVPVDVAGILFTANPVTGERSEMIVNASFGLGEAIVGGQVTPDTYVVDRDSLTVKEATLSTKSHKIFADDNQGTRLEAIVAEQRNQSSLPAGALVALASMALEIERHFGGVPQDIEWALADDDLSLLQSRPITNLRPQPIEVSWELPADLDPAVDVLMRRQILENVPAPVSPLFEDLYLIAGIKKVRMLNGFAYMPFRRTTSTSARRVKRSDHGNSQKTSIEIAAKERRDMEMFVAQLSIDDLAHFNKVAGELDGESLAHLLTNPDGAGWNLRLVTEAVDPIVEGFHAARKPAYLAKIAEWHVVEKKTASNDHLLAGIRELAAAEASYWVDGPKAKGVGLGGRTTQSNSLTLATSKVTDRQLQIFLDRHLPEFTSGHFLTRYLREGGWSNPFSNPCAPCSRICTCTPRGPGH